MVANRIRRLVAAALIAMAAPAQAKEAPPIAFVGVNVVPMDTDRVLPDQTVIVRGGRIAAIGVRATTDVPAGAVTVDGRGRYLLPGLADMHTHLLSRDMTSKADAAAKMKQRLFFFVATGVTTIRNMAGGPEVLDARRQVDTGAWVGPHIVTATPIVDGLTPTWQGAIKVDDDTDMKALVAGFVRDGYDMIKVYNDLPRVAYARLLEAADARDIRVIGHVPFSVGIESALAGRQYSIEHLRGYELDGVRPQALIHDGGRNPERFGSWSHMSDDRMRDLVRKTVAAGTWNCPTFIVEEWLYDAAKQRRVAQDPLLAYLPPDLRASFAPNDVSPTFSREARSAMKGSLPVRYKFVKMLSDAGAGLLIGTDTAAPYVVPGYTPIDEMQHFVKAGLTPYKALRAATIDPARFLGVDKDSGSVTVGKRADLLLVDANPLENIGNLWRRAGVMLNGEWMSEKTLRQKLEALRKAYPASAGAAPVH